MQRFDAFFARWDKQLTVLFTVLVVIFAVGYLLDGKLDWRDGLAAVIIVGVLAQLAERLAQRRRSAAESGDPPRRTR